jgi:hypothetical protein
LMYRTGRILNVTFTIRICLSIIVLYFTNKTSSQEHA